MSGSVMMAFVFKITIAVMGTMIALTVAMKITAVRQSLCGLIVMYMLVVTEYLLSFPLSLSLSPDPPWGGGTVL